MRNEILTADGYKAYNETPMSEWRSRSDGTLGGIFQESSKFDEIYWYEGQELKSTAYDKYLEEKVGINSKQFKQLKVPSERVSAALKLDYDITDDITFYSQVQWSGNFTVNDKSPEDSGDSETATYTDRNIGEPGTVNLGRIPIDNPYVPAEIRLCGEQRLRRR